ncbi:MAG: long-chain alkane monooxygenase [Acetobacteraceae bacterium]|jgi:FMN-dependent oxidoreductase (nitrilotriacetate monooxygenase family)|nr:long-chain alkane monooxygenase [Acetobacteraceae bacterium]
MPHPVLTRQIRLNAFDMNCIGHQSPGLWTHPDDRADSYNSLEYWTDLARILERGKFDALFLADVLGIYDIYKGSGRTALEHAVQVPVNDPLMVIPPMAMVTEHLGFGVTCALSYELPYPFARRMSTLDHLTKGRVGWNIVTGYLDSAARGMGMAKQVAHDDRYDVAEDYVQATYKLWEASWEDGAVLRDRQGRRFADPDKIHRVVHEGPHFKVDAIHLCEPSPQRTPVLFQAGASKRGRDFAARHAECVFINGPSKKVIGNIVSDLRRRAVAAGRDPRDLVIFTMMTVITDTTPKAARNKYQDYLGYVSEEGALALMSGWTGLDFGAMDPDEVVRFTDKADAQTSALEAFTTADPDREWTVREIARHAALGGRGPVVIGSAEEVAEELRAWVEETDVDGFNLAYALTPGTFADIADLVVPELQARGLFKRDYAPGTFREKLFGRGPLLPASHPAAAVRVAR